MFFIYLRFGVWGLGFAVFATRLEDVSGDVAIHDLLSKNMAWGHISLSKRHIQRDDLCTCRLLGDARFLVDDARDVSGDVAIHDLM